MKQAELGRSGINASVVAFGAWAIGGWKWGGTDAKQSVAALQAGMDAGINLIDGAAVYGFGLSEELVGEAIKHKPRDEVVIISKCGLRWDIESTTLHAESEGKRIFRTHAAESIVWEVEQSLQRLGTDYIDAYLTHWPDPLVPVEDLAATMESLVAAGKIRTWGMCNSSPEDIAVALKSDSFSIDQEKYSMLDRQQDIQNLPACVQNRLAFLAYSPMAKGLLTGRINKQREYSSGDQRIENPRFTSEALDALQVLLQPVQKIAAARQMQTHHLVLAWTLQQAGVSHVLVGARTAVQARSNAAAGSLELRDYELLAINDALSVWPGFSFEA
ncbi:MAG: aldo/keto reductase [Granulosicoccaceae bacterium]